jgi:outer membrane protein OmpA-like peptidoglycan-associated protein
MTSRFHHVLFALSACFFMLAAFTAPKSVFAQKKKAARVLQNPNLTVTKLDILNSPAKEANLSLSPDGRFLYFATYRGGQSWTRFDEGFQRNDVDIYVAERPLGTRDQWQTPRPLEISINTENDEDEPVISSDGQNLTFLSARAGWEANGGPYYTAERHGKKWENIAGLGGGITQFFMEMLRDMGSSASDLPAHVVVTDGMTIAPDGNTMLFVCGKNDPKKPNLDIYISRKVDGVWGAVQPLSINTPKNERSVFLAQDGKTLYFASAGLGGLGGTDIFKTTLNNDGSCGEVVNLGAPFNSAEDDCGFVVSANGKEAFFIRNGDIYSVDLMQASGEARPRPMVILRGTVKEKSTGKVLEASIEINELTETDGLANPSAGPPYSATGRSNSQTGEYALTLKPNKRYIQTIMIPKYKNITREFEAGADEEIGVTYDAEVEPRPPKPSKTSATNATTKAGGGKSATLAGGVPSIKTVYFNSDDFGLEDTYLDELDKVAEFFRLTGGANSDYYVEIQGFADDRGSYEYNIKLSQRRVNDVVDYLFSTGVERKQMSLQWFGEEGPAAANTNEEGRSLNRRVELRFFKKQPDNSTPSTPSAPSTPSKSSTPTGAQPRTQAMTTPSRPLAPAQQSATASPIPSQARFVGSTRAAVVSTRATLSSTRATERVPVRATSATIRSTTSTISPKPAAATTPDTTGKKKEWRLKASPKNNEQE